ncbi:MAG: hypothetical protein DRO99_03360 [Candidatus Aenigmatarchaeota archaeon]|nr:MAG: hypothetical protein DRO99_03360 [Candidatus Aenigmarchaeota archaeon]
MYLTEEDVEMLNGSVSVLSKMYQRLRDLPVEEARRDLSELDAKAQKKYARKDRKDTKFFDIVAEDAISIGDGYQGHLDLFQKIFGQQGIIITEECGRVPREPRIEHDTPVIISDPVDGSSYFDDVIERMSRASDSSEVMGDLFDREMEEVGVESLRRHACNSSVTLLRDNMIKYAVVVNLFTGDIYVGSSEGVFMGDIRSATSAGDISAPVEFDDTEGLTMLCYTKPGKYEQNREGTHLRFFPLDPAATAEIGPIGPMRFTNLVRYGEDDCSGIEVVAHNGEKVQEILPNVAMAMFSGGRLRAYKLFCDPEYTQHRAGKGMTPNLANSLYSDGLIVNTGIKSVFLNNYDYPSEFRDTTAIIAAGNDAALTMFTGMVERDYAARVV